MLRVAAGLDQILRRLTSDPKLNDPLLLRLGGVFAKVCAKSALSVVDAEHDFPLVRMTCRDRGSPRVSPIPGPIRGRMGLMV